MQIICQYFLQFYKNTLCFVTLRLPKQPKCKKIIQHGVKNSYKLHFVNKISIAEYDLCINFVIENNNSPTPVTENYQQLPASYLAGGEQQKQFKTKTLC